MKKFLILILLLFIYVSLNNMVVYSKESINLNLKKEEIAITFIDNNILVSNMDNTLFLLNNVNNNIKKFGNINILNANNIKINFDYNNEYIIKKNFIIDGINYELDGNIIKIKYNNYMFCIYNKKTYNLSNSYGCNFLYLFDTKSINTINVDENIDIIFFNKDVEIPTYFLEDLYSKWIDIYKLSKDEYVVMKINKDDYKIIIIPE